MPGGRSRSARTITIRQREEYRALQARRAEEATPAYAAAYGKRAGIEGTIAQGVRRCGLRRARYVGLAKAHLGQTLAAAAINYLRVAQWLMGTPRAKTRPSPFAVLMTLP